MVSIVTTVYAPGRVNSVKELNKSIKSNAGVETQHIIVIDGHPITAKLLEGIGDTFIVLPRNGEHVRAINIGEKFARYQYIVQIDDDCIVETKDCFKKAIDIYRQAFPRSRGVLGFHDGANNCPRFMTTRYYAYMYNLGNFVWPEYIHSYDHEVFLKANFHEQYTFAKELRIVETKHKDKSRKVSLSTGLYDDKLEELRKSRNFPNVPTLDLPLLHNKRMKQIKRNWLNV